jgi:hypothetical protein
LSIALSPQSIIGPKCGLVAALFTSPSTRPNFSTADANSACTSDSLPVWHATACTRSPPANRPAAASRSGCFREAITTFAPASRQPRAIASPIPRLPPVTTMTLSASWLIA